MNSQQNRRLDSWKAIAAFLDRDVRTAMRWEKEGGMPVHRVPGARRGASVFAYTGELDDWLGRGAPDGKAATTDRGVGDAEPTVLLEPTGGRETLFVATAVAVVVLAGSLGAFWLASGVVGDLSNLPIARIEASRHALVARTVDERVAWTLEHPRGWGFNGESIDRVVDLGGGPDSELLIMAETFDPRRQAFLQAELFAFAPSGDLLWDLSLADVLQFGAGTFSGPWASMAFEPVSLAAGGPRLAWAVHHYTWWPSFLALVDGEGRVASRFVNAGWITRITTLHRGSRSLLLAGGVSNSRAGAMLAVLDAGSFPGSSPEDSGSAFECLSCGPGKPLRYFVFPPTDVTLASGQPYNEVIQIEAAADGGISVTTREGDRLSARFWVYRFSPRLDLLAANPSDDFWPAHRDLRLAGKLDHGERDCPWRSPQPILSWTAASGWHEVAAAR